MKGKRVNLYNIFKGEKHDFIDELLKNCNIGVAITAKNEGKRIS